MNMTPLDKFNEQPFDKILSHRVNEESLTPQGVEEMIKLAQSNGFNLPNSFDWSSETRNGRITRRISKYAYSEYGVRLSPSTITIFGNIFNQNLVKEMEYRFDLTRNFYWERGEFSDEKSCFWTDKLPSRLEIERANGWAIRFYDNKSGKGIGRAWAVGLDNGNVVVFNTYGATLTTKKVGVIMSDFIKEPYFGEVVATTDHDFFINNNLGFLIGNKDADKLADFSYDQYSKSVSLPFKRISNVGYCDKCGRLTDHVIDIRTSILHKQYRFRCKSHIRE